MKVNQLHNLLRELAIQCDAAAQPEQAKGLRNLAELFDARGNQKVVKTLNEIRTVRRLNARPVTGHD
jgi:hypothetical protein